MNGVLLDQSLFLWLNHALSGPAATWFFGIATWLGNGFVLALLVVPSMARWDRQGLRHHLMPMVIAVATTGALVTVAKLLFGRPRPPLLATAQELAIHVPFGVPPDKSFPSGHAQTSFGVAVYLSLLYPKAAPAFLSLAMLVGMSRVALGVHFPSDVIVGASVGAVGSWLAFRWVQQRKQSRA